MEENWYIHSNQNYHQRRAKQRKNNITTKKCEITLFLRTRREERTFLIRDFLYEFVEVAVTQFP